MLKVERKRIKELWHKHGMSCKLSYCTDRIKEICDDFQVEFKPGWIHTDQPRVGGETFLLAICKEHRIQPNEKVMDMSNRMSDEGSRKTLVERAFLEGD